MDWMGGWVGGLGLFTVAGELGEVIEGGRRADAPEVVPPEENGGFGGVLEEGTEPQLAWRGWVGGWVGG